MQVERIVVGTDFGRASLAAARWARRSLAPAAELIVVHVTPRPSDAPSRAVAERLRELCDELAPMGTGLVRGILEPGSVVAGIAAVATRARADLVVVGAHEVHVVPNGERGGPEAIVGTAQRLVRCAPCPVLLAVGAMHGPPLRLLVPVAGGDIGASTLEWARVLEERFDARVAIVHLASEVRPHAPDESRLPRWRELAATRGPDRLFADVVAGESPSAIVAEAERFRSDLVLLDAAADGAAASADESILTGVLRRATCPVLVTAGARR